MAGFSAEFLEGMTETNRSRFLGDVGESDPRSWAWGGPQRPPIDGLILLYATTPDILDAAAVGPAAAARRAGHRGRYRAVHP